MHIYFTVTNDLSFDQRMQRICASLASNGYTVTLVGRKRKNSKPLTKQPFRQHRLNCIFDKGILFYAEYNARLLFFLISKKMDALCAIDLDTILPCLFVAKRKNIPLIYDAHELFTEMKEVRSRPMVLKAWTAIEKYAVPKITIAYTVGDCVAKEFKKRYNKDFAVIRNVPLTKELQPFLSNEPFLLYQGAVNEGRCFEWIIPAMKQIPYKLIVCGDGNFMHQLKRLIKENKVEDRVELKGMLDPAELWKYTSSAFIGLNITEKEGLNQYLCLPNKFFDYIQAGLPQVMNNYPEFAAVNEEYQLGLMIEEISVEAIVKAIQTLVENKELYAELKLNALKAGKIFNWKNEEHKLLDIYHKILPLA